MFYCFAWNSSILKEKMTFAGDIQVGSWQQLKVSEVWYVSLIFFYQILSNTVKL